MRGHMRNAAQFARQVVARVMADDGGQDLIEYALLTAIIGISGLLILSTLSTTMGTAYGSWNTAGQNAWEPCPPQSAAVLVDAQGISMNSAHIVGLTIASLACVTDLRTRRIPNVLTFGAALAGCYISLSAAVSMGSATRRSAGSSAR